MGPISFPIAPILRTNQSDRTATAQAPTTHLATQGRERDAKRMHEKYVDSTYDKDANMMHENAREQNV